MSYFLSINFFLDSMLPKYLLLIVLSFVGLKYPKGDSEKNIFSFDEYIFVINISLYSLRHNVRKF